MGVNLVPIVRRFRIETKTFSTSDCAVAEGCAIPGTRKLLRFDFLCWNAGNADLRMGSPSQNPQWYEYSPCHRHFHLKQFNGYKVYDCRGRERKGNKQAFCLEDSERLSAGPATPQFRDCNNNQGISAGWADLYGSGLDCQWIDITGLPDGDYAVEARTNRSGIVKEDWYGDNFTWVGVRITGNVVTEITAPCYPEDCIGFDPQHVQAKNISSSWKVVDGDHWILDFGSIPFPGEDAIQFNTSNVSATKVGGRWKVTDGPMRILDFGVSEMNARKSAWIIKKYGFRYQCFVGRPNAPMMYFRR